MAELDLAHCLEVGKVGKAHGIRGQFKLHSSSGQPENFSDYDEIILQAKDGSLQRIVLVAVRIQGRFAVASSKTIVDRTQAEALTGSKVWVAESQLADLPDDEFYWHDIIGAQVVSSSGEEIGILDTIFATAGSDMLVVKSGREEVLIPAQPEYIVEVETDKVVVDLPPGMLELNKK